VYPAVSQDSGTRIVFMIDDGNGICNTDGVNGYPSGLHLGAIQKKELLCKTREHLGAELKRKGANMALGPVFEALAESFAEFLTGKALTTIPTLPELCSTSPSLPCRSMSSHRSSTLWAMSRRLTVRLLAPSLSAL
jgi:hypothetical protein